MKMLLACLAVATSSLSWGQTLNYSEATDGDLSDDYTQPSILSVGLGDNFLEGTLTGGSRDLDMFRLVIPAGLEVIAIHVVSAAGGGNGSYLLLQPGEVLDAAPSNSYREPIGYSILSVDSNGMGGNVLPTIMLPGVPIPPFFGEETLTEGSYAGWLNETGQGSSYRLNFETKAVSVPEPTLVFLPALALLLGKRRRTQS